MGKRNQKISKLRQQLRHNETLRALHVEQVLNEHGPMIRGSYLVLGRKCGKENCRCTRGELHPNPVLAASVEGKTKSVYVRPADREKVKRRSRRYQRFRKARAELVKLAKASAELIDALQELLTEPYPSSRKQRSPGKEGKKTRKR